MIDLRTVTNLLAWTLQTAALALVAAALIRVLRVDAPTIRHATWRVVFAVCLLLPLLQPWRTTTITTTSIVLDSVNALPVLGLSQSTAAGAAGWASGLAASARS